ncbi:MAG: tetratricopeptide repeat protein [Pirellulaceae bacterium]
MRMSAALTVLMLASLPLVACSRLVHRSAKSYTTVVADSNRDGDKARAECERAAKFFDKGNLEKAEAALQDALIADVSYAPAHNNLGHIYFEQGRLYLAAWEFEYARRLLPESAEVANNLGLVYEAADQLPRAIEYYRMALSLDAGNPEYGGNLARALLRTNQDPAEVAALLQDLVFNDARPEWVEWATDQMNLRSPLRAAAPWNMTIQQPDVLEPLPPPKHIDDLPLPKAPKL